MTDTVLRTEPEPGIALVTLNRPERLNAMSPELVADLHEVLGDDRRRPLGAGRRPDGRGPRASAPASTSRRRRSGPPAREGRAGGRGRHGRPAAHRRRSSPGCAALRQPVIAAVNGAGGRRRAGAGARVRRPRRGRVGPLQRRLHARRPVGLRHRRELAAAPPHRRVGRLRAAAHRPADRRRGGPAHRPRRPGRARRRGGRRRARRRPARSPPTARWACG